MATMKVRRVRVCARLSVELRARLNKYSAASGISESTVIESALRKYLEIGDDTELLLRRFDRFDREMARNHRDLELLSEAFGRYMRLWFVAHAPHTGEASKAAARGAAETQYKQFAQHLGVQFGKGHRFVDDLPVEALPGRDDAKEV